MSPYRRHVLVGLAMLLSLVALGWMIVQFGGRLAVPFQGNRTTIAFKADRVDGINPGSSVRYLGFPVGTVQRVTFDQPGNSFHVEATLEADITLPAEIRASIVVPNFLGSASIIKLEPNGPAAGGKLRPGVTIPATYEGLDALPPEFTELAREMRLIAEDLRRSGAIESLGTTLRNLDQQITRGGQLIESLNQFTGDPGVQEDLRTSLADFREAIASSRRTAANAEELVTRLGSLPDRVNVSFDQIDSAVTDARGLLSNANAEVAQVSGQLDSQLAQLGRLLDELNATARSMNQGDGTVGMLLNDPRLYNSILTTSEALEQTIADFRRLSRQIEEEGFRVRF